MLSLRQSPHNAFKGYQSNCVGRKRSQETGYETSPKAPWTIPSPDLLRSILPSRKPPLPIIQLTTQWISHDPLFDDIGRVGCQPEHLGGKSTGPEIDCRGREICVI